MASLFPIFVSLENKRCLVVGGGKVAERKVENLLEYPVQIDLVSPQATPKLQNWAAEGKVNWIARNFQLTDIQDAFLVFAATDDLQINREIARLCQKEGILVNAVDDPAYCDFFVPSIIRRNSLVLAISTEGKSPAYAKRLRRQMEEIITDAHGKFVDLLGEQREIVKETVPDIRIRQAIFEAMAGLDILDLITAGRDEEIKERFKECMSLWQE
ncbi:MAG TPA: bifunctional precorrin-2 dehydrogenase/sirohydrochlorin ferrochelatase [Syntrophomonadaceae bacterium]|nr:bifunctional precorrin-2 dehydrogenase/sirohydrochlorin ferrochelatase [Syntrophomonadaceae bacterium]HPU47770.1 bifunctional precorrin-2 dehydrogenase/sirohydrochlorin ferrochelatase [Syntrophomonadaceae bacterium]